METNSYEIQFIPIEWENSEITIEDGFTAGKVAFFEKIKGLTEKKNRLYQIYGNSPIYGENVLLYIGQTKKFTTRQNQHLKSDFGRGLNLTFRFGYCDELFIERNANKYLSIAESILITMLKPSYNSSNIKDISEMGKDMLYIILNRGNRGALRLECSNVWWDDNYNKYVNNVKPITVIPGPLSE